MKNPQSNQDTEERGQTPASPPKTPNKSKASNQENTVFPRIRVLVHNGQTILLPDCNDDLRQGIERLGKAIEGADLDFVQDLMWQLANAAMRNGVIDEKILSFSMSVVIESKPRDRLDAMLVAEMTALHVATMDSARHLGNATTLLEFDSHQRALSKLARTYVTQLEARKRYRSDGEQKVTVQTVAVSEGGQAIVGNVTQNAPGESNVKCETPPAITHTRVTPMPFMEQGGAHEPVPSKRNTRQK